MARLNELSNAKGRCRVSMLRHNNGALESRSPKTGEDFLDSSSHFDRRLTRSDQKNTVKFLELQPEVSSFEMVAPDYQIFVDGVAGIGGRERRAKNRHRITAKLPGG